MAPIAVEELSPAELSEGYFREMQQEHRSTPRPGPYYHHYFKWLRQGLPVYAAYTERAKIHVRAKAYLQARADAQAGVGALQRLRKVCNPRLAATLRSVCPVWALMQGRDHS